MAGALPRNDEVAEQLELLADLLEIEGEASFRVLAYRRAATRVRDTAAPIAELALQGQAKALSGIGKTIEEKIVQIVEDGEIHALTTRRDRIPPEVVLFTRLPGLGPKTAARIWQELGVTTLAELQAAAEQERLRGLAGLGAKTEERILKALADAAAKPADEPRRALLGNALPRLLAVVDALREDPAADLVSEAGSARRRRESVRDLDIIATALEPAALIDTFTGFDWIAKVEAKGDTKATVLAQDGLRYDLRVVPPEAYGNLLQHFTGSKHHNVALRERAVKDGLSVSEYGVQDVESGDVFTTRDEAELYAHLGYVYIPPELRENSGELEAARRGELPALVEYADVRGDLHSHTTWSDGKATLEEMVATARGRGYEYLAICDHAQRLRGDLLARQAEAIAALAEQAAPMRILRGIEVNVRADGSLDVDDETLAGLDWVMASVHSGFDRDPTGRVLAAMDNPHVDCIGHVTNRRINTRSPSDVAIERVVEQALATGTFLEINSQPDRLDLRDVHARLAGEAGVKVVVSSDGHSVGALRYVEFGIAQARRAWLTKDQILNTRPWPEIERLLGARP